LRQQSTLGELSHVKKSKLLWKANTVFSFKVILFSGAKKFPLSDHKTRAAASPIQPEGAKKKLQVGPNIYHLFFPKFDDS